MAKTVKWNGKLPKRIAGVKVPKALRRSAFSDFVMSPIGQMLVAEVIYHAGARFAGKTADAAADAADDAPRVLKKGARKAGHVAEDVTGLAVGGTAAMSRAVGAAVEAFMASLKHDHADARFAPAAGQQSESWRH